ncbi:hypothetical protein WDU94_008981 [Cyamophila willieti]
MCKTRGITTNTRDLSKKPHVMVASGESREVHMIQKDLEGIFKQLAEDEEFPEIKVEIFDSEFSKIHASLVKAGPTLTSPGATLARPSHGVISLNCVPRMNHVSQIPSNTRQDWEKDVRK